MSSIETETPPRPSEQQSKLGNGEPQNDSTVQQGQQQDQQGQSRSVAEWITTGIAGAVLLGVAALILYLWLVAPNNEPVIRVSRVGEIRIVGEQWYVPFEVHNLGNRSVTAVATKAELIVDGQAVEQAQIHFTWLSGGETERGVFVFANDPASGELRMSVGSFKIP